MRKKDKNVHSHLWSYKAKIKICWIVWSIFSLSFTKISYSENVYIGYTGILDEIITRNAKFLDPTFFFSRKLLNSRSSLEGGEISLSPSPLPILLRPMDGAPFVQRALLSSPKNLPRLSPSPTHSQTISRPKMAAARSSLDHALRNGALRCERSRRRRRRRDQERLKDKRWAAAPLLRDLAELAPYPPFPEIASVRFARVMLRVM